MILQVQHVHLGDTAATESDDWKERPLQENLARHHGIPGADTPPILLQECSDGSYIVCDGHHRRLAAIRRGDETIAAYVIPAGLRPPYPGEGGSYEVEWQGRILSYQLMWFGEYAKAEAQASW
jgi:ParB-like nuclease family protein